MAFILSHAETLSQCSISIPGALLKIIERLTEENK
jgi:hypothetical protein